MLIMTEKLQNLRRAAMVLQGADQPARSTRSIVITSPAMVQTTR